MYFTKKPPPLGMMSYPSIILSYLFLMSAYNAEAYAQHSNLKVFLIKHLRLRIYNY